MLIVILYLTVFLTVLVLGALAWIDLRTRLLPNVLVAAFAMLGFIFQTVTLFEHESIQGMAMGALIGGGSLYLIRIVGNYYYKTDTLGLGDVKLMAAAGLWLGSYDILIALTLGALAGVIHGGAAIGCNWLRGSAAGPLSTYAVPAGPGFIVGILIAALAKFYGLPHLAF
jgi:leader peptidase (prepilin peptidase)/N-methyltransferase